MGVLSSVTRSSWRRRRSSYLAAIVMCALLYYYYNPTRPVGGGSDTSASIISRPDDNFEVVPYTSLKSNKPVDRFEEWTVRSVRNLRACIKAKTCGPNQEKAILFSANWVNDAQFKDARDGVNSWSVSMVGVIDDIPSDLAEQKVTALQQLGYTIMFAQENCKDTLLKYRQAQENIKVVAMRHGSQCLRQRGFVSTEDEPRLIPRWKTITNVFFAQIFQLNNVSSFDIDYYPTQPRYKDLDTRWSLQAEPGGDQTAPGLEPFVIPTSVEGECSRLGYVRHKLRSSLLLLSPGAEYFQPGRGSYTWNATTFSHIQEDFPSANLHFHASYVLDSRKGESDLDGVENLGALKHEQLANEIAKSHLLIGVGDPDLSPLPYIALCTGTPVLIPIKGWDDSNPTDRSKWKTQNPLLNSLGPPWVYHVFKRDYEGFKMAIRAALSGPPADTLLLDGYRAKDVRSAVTKLMENDWQQAARDSVKAGHSKQDGWIF